MQTPPDFRPPPRWRPPAHVPADSNLEFLYKEPLRFAFGLVKTLVVLAIGGVVLLFALAREGVLEQALEALLSDPKAKQVAGAALDRVGAALEKAQHAANQAAKPSDYFARAGELLDALEQQLNTKNLRLTRVVLYPTYGSVEAQNPAEPAQVTRYLVKNGRIVNQSAASASRGRVPLEQRLFDRNEVVLDQVSALIQRTENRLAYKAGKASHVIIEKDLPFSKHLVIRVYVRDTANNGRIDYTGKGVELRVYK